MATSFCLDSPISSLPPLIFVLDDAALGIVLSAFLQPAFSLVGQSILVTSLADLLEVKTSAPALVICLLPETSLEKLRTLWSAIVCLKWYLLPVTCSPDSIEVGPLLHSSTLCLDCLALQENTIGFAEDYPFSATDDFHSAHLRCLIACLCKWLLTAYQHTPTGLRIVFDRSTGAVLHHHVINRAGCELCNQGLGRLTLEDVASQITTLWNDNSQ